MQCVDICIANTNLIVSLLKTYVLDFSEEMYYSFFCLKVSPLTPDVVSVRDKAVTFRESSGNESHPIRCIFNCNKKICLIDFITRW